MTRVYPFSKRQLFSTEAAGDEDEDEDEDGAEEEAVDAVEREKAVALAAHENSRTIGIKKRFSKDHRISMMQKEKKGLKLAFGEIMIVQRPNEPEWRQLTY